MISENISSMKEAERASGMHWPRRGSFGCDDLFTAKVDAKVRLVGV